MIQYPKVLISGSYNAFKQENFDCCGTYMASGLYKSSKFKLPIYIGSAQSIKERVVGGHFYDLNRNQHDNPPFQCAWNVHNSKEGFVWFLLEESSLDQQYVIEQKWLDFYDAFVDNFGGFNINRIANKPPSMIGRKRPHLEETKKKISKSHMGKILSEEHIANISIAVQGSNNPFYGKTHDKLTKQKMSEKAKNKIISDEHRNKISESLKNRVYINEFNENGMPNVSKPYRLISPNGELIIGYGIRKFAELNNLSYASIRLVLAGKQKEYKGWTKPIDSQILNDSVITNNN